MPRLTGTNKAILYLKRSIESQKIALEALEKQGSPESNKIKTVKVVKKMGRPRKS